MTDWAALRAGFWHVVEEVHAWPRVTTAEHVEDLTRVVAPELRAKDAEIARLKDELGADVDGMCTGMHADVAEARAAWEDMRDERDRYRLAWKSARRRVTRAKRNTAGELRFTRNMWSDALRDLHRYRLAWLSARRRAADEANFGMEALELKRQETATLQAENERLRAFAADVIAVRGWCMDGEPDCARRFLSAIYDSTYELEDAEREGRPFADRIHRAFARGEYDDVNGDEAP